MRTKGVKPDVITYNASISACEKGGQWEKALQLLEEMRAKGVEPDVILYSASISACEKGGQWEKALQLLEEMRAKGRSLLANLVLVRLIVVQLEIWIANMLAFALSHWQC
jgi:pentatricopeptide repeat domain-containing protein 1